MNKSITVLVCINIYKRLSTKSVFTEVEPFVTYSVYLISNSTSAQHEISANFSIVRFKNRKTFQLLLYTLHKVAGFKSNSVLVNYTKLIVTPHALLCLQVEDFKLANA